jgi:transposase-like protein
MRKGRFSEEQMVAIIREADRDPVAAVAKRHGISEQTIYTWRKRFGALAADRRRNQVWQRQPFQQGALDRAASPPL